MVKKAGESSSSGSKTTFASSNWLALQKSIKKKPSRDDVEASTSRPKKRRKLDEQSRTQSTRSQSPTPSTSYTQPTRNSDGNSTGRKNGESIPALRDMILGKIDPTESQKQPGKYLSLDCEMVGIGLDGTESSLARVSIVNFHGHTLLDIFVKQKERVVDYRTQWSGVREKDMITARPFEEVQREVAALLRGRVLVGHAVFNDLKALLLSHPRHLTRDTQHLAYKHKSTKSKYIALRNLVRQELDVVIQSGEHSSVTDARATMAVFRLNRREWDKGFMGVVEAGMGKRKREDGDELAATTQEYPGGGRKGISSGLSVIVRGGKGSVPARAKVAGAGGGGGKAGTGGKTKTKWWKELVGSGSSGKGGKMTMGS